MGAIEPSAAYSMGTGPRAVARRLSPSVSTGPMPASSMRVGRTSRVETGSVAAAGGEGGGGEHQGDAGGGLAEARS